MIPLTLPEFDPEIAEEFGYQAIQGNTFLGVPVIDGQSILHLVMRFAFNLLVSWIVVHFFYYRKSKRRDYYLTFMVFASAMFLLLFLLDSIKLQIGMTLGLFAIFGMIRYRTETIPVREMTYLFAIIAMSVINGLALSVSYAELIVANLLMLGLIWVLEGVRIHNRSAKLVLYDRIDLIVPEKREELIADLEKRLGLKIDNIEIGHVDFLKDAAYIKVYYSLAKGESNSIDSLTRAKDYVE